MYWLTRTLWRTGGKQGHCKLIKGFPVGARYARECSRPQCRFQANNIPCFQVFSLSSLHHPGSVVQCQIDDSNLDHSSSWRPQIRMYPLHRVLAALPVPKRAESSSTAAPGVSTLPATVAMSPDQLSITVAPSVRGLTGALTRPNVRSFRLAGASIARLLFSALSSALLKPRATWLWLDLPCL